jgi:hypothetical protein
MRSITPDELQTITSEWLFTYSLVYPMTATPYIHVFANHFHEFLRDGYDLALHTLQGELSSGLKIKFNNKVLILTKIKDWRV